MYYLFRGQETFCSLCDARKSQYVLCNARMNRVYVLVLFDVLYHVLCLGVKKPYVHFVMLG